jgi:hypothetical protein
MPDQVSGAQSTTGSDGSLADRQGTPGFPSSIASSVNGQASSGGTDRDSGGK